MSRDVALEQFLTIRGKQKLALGLAQLARHGDAEPCQRLGVRSVSSSKGALRNKSLLRTLLAVSGEQAPHVPKILKGFEDEHATNQCSRRVACASGTGALTAGDRWSVSLPAYLRHAAGARPVERLTATSLQRACDVVSCNRG